MSPRHAETTNREEHQMTTKNLYIVESRLVKNRCALASPFVGANEGWQEVEEVKDRSDYKHVGYIVKVKNALENKIVYRATKDGELFGEFKSKVGARNALAKVLNNNDPHTKENNNEKRNK